MYSNFHHFAFKIATYSTGRRDVSMLLIGWVYTTYTKNINITIGACK